MPSLLNRTTGYTSNCHSAEIFLFKKTEIGYIE